MRRNLLQISKKVLACVLTVTLAIPATISTSTVVKAAVTLPDAVAAYDFTGSKLADTSSHDLADISVDDGASGASATEDGLVLSNGYVTLPNNIFSDTEASNISGITVSMKYKKNN